MAKNNWHVCENGLIPISTAVRQLCQIDSSTILEWLHDPTCSLKSKLLIVVDKAWRFEGVLVHRRQMVRQWLQTNGYEADAREFSSQLDALFAELDLWESEAHYIAHGRQEWQIKEADGLFVEIVDILGDDDGQLTAEGSGWFYDLINEAERTFNYLNQLANTITARLVSDQQREKQLASIERKIDSLSLKSDIDNEVLANGNVQKSRKPQRQDDVIDSNLKESKRKPTVSERMMAEMALNLQTVQGWSAKQWAKHLNCAKSTVVETKTWQSLHLMRLKMKAERQNDRRRK